MTPEEILAILPDKVPYNPERQYQIGHAGKVDKLTFQVSI